MKTYNLNELSMNEVIEKVRNHNPEMDNDAIMNLKLNDLNDIFDTLSDADNPAQSEEMETFRKHLPSRKKKYKRMKIYNSKIKYKKKKREGEMCGKYTRKKVSCDTTNRSYINKASKGFVPNRRFHLL